MARGRPAAAPAASSDANTSRKRKVTEEPVKAPKKVKSSNKPEGTEEPVKAAKNVKSSNKTKATEKPAETSKKTVASHKRKATEEPAEVPQKDSTSRKRKTTEEPAEASKKVKSAINFAPKAKLHVYVCGSGESGELGLGVEKNATNVKRPRLNPHLDADKVGVVEVATGGMHCLALTHDNKILSWGVNDQGALGRDTEWDGGLRDMADDKSDASSDTGSETDMNPREATPAAIPAESFPEGTVITQLAAGDSCSFALTADGFVYGWGTFRTNEGIFGFLATPDGKAVQAPEVQRRPILIPGLKNITHIACGANHVLALDKAGNAFTWGTGQQHQLGRRLTERHKAQALLPHQFMQFKGKLKYIATGSDHSFAIDKKDNVWAWGVNNFGETGVTESAGDDNAAVVRPTKIGPLCGRKVKVMKGGAHHSIAVTEAGDCLVWGRLDGDQCGMELDKLPEDDDLVVRDEPRGDKPGRPRILLKPTQVPNVPKASYATAASDHTIAITQDGQAYSWGFNVNYQTGQGETDDDVEVATLIDNTAVRGKKLNWAGAGGQFSVLTSIA